MECWTEDQNHYLHNPHPYDNVCKLGSKWLLPVIVFNLFRDLLSFRGVFVFLICFVSTCLCVYLSLCLPVYYLACLSVCHSVCLPVCVSGQVEIFVLNIDCSGLYYMELVSGQQMLGGGRIPISKCGNCHRLTILVPERQVLNIFTTLPSYKKNSYNYNCTTGRPLRSQQ